MTEEEGEVGLILREEFEGGANEVGIGIEGEAKLSAEASVVVSAKLLGIGIEHSFG